MPTSAELSALVLAATDHIQHQRDAKLAATAAVLTPQQLAAYIDHTLLKPDATEMQIRQLCAEATQYRFASVCVNPTWVAFCCELLIGSPVKVCTVIGFPLGATLPAVKAYEAEQAIAMGAQEVDMVLNIGRLKSGNLAAAYDDIAVVVSAAKNYSALVKVIIETALLTDEEKIAACVLAQQAGADFVKTSTGFSGGGATIADVHLMREVISSQMGVKASGGVRTAEDARKLVAAGATRIGASAGVRIVEEMTSASVAPSEAVKDSY
jgi:deoxyribose-phosphate aldolase